MSEVPTSDGLREEIHAVIKRWSHESDVTTYQVLGVLRVIETDLIELLEKYNEQKDAPLF